MASVAADKAISKYRNTEYPKEIWYFLACLIFVIALSHWISVLVSKLGRPRQRSSDPESSGAVKRKSLVRRIPVAAVDAYRVVAFRWTIHFGGSYTLNLAEIFLTCAYIIALFTWSFVNTTNLSGFKYDLRYWSNRVGIIASSQFPLVTALGTKNNVLTLLTGVGHDKLNYLHRMTARVCFVLLWTHGIGRIVKGIELEEWSEEWLPLGLMGLVAFSLLCIVSVRPVRNQAYELFYFMHFVMVLLFLVGGYYHTRNFELHYYIWPCFLIWGLDRLIRVLRFAYFSVAPKQSSVSGSDTKLELLSPHLVRLSVPAPKGWHWRPGQAAYLAVPGISILPVEVHPFTIASVDGSPDAVPSSSNSSQSDIEKVPRAEFEGDGTAWKGRELVFLINARDGFTKRLGAAAKAGVSVKVGVEGPYGESHDLAAYEDVVLVAGGTGVTNTLPLFLDTIRRVRESQDTSVCRKVTFIWAIRDISHISWVSSALLQALRAGPPSFQVTIDIRVHLTNSRQEPPPESPQAWDDDSVHDEKVGEKGEKDVAGLKDLMRSGLFRLEQGRPDLTAILKAEVDGAGVSGGRMVVNVCGSQGIANAVRSALSMNRVLAGGPSITLNTESFGYA